MSPNTESISSSKSTTLFSSDWRSSSTILQGFLRQIFEKYADSSLPESGSSCLLPDTMAFILNQVFEVPVKSNIWYKNNEWHMNLAPQHRADICFARHLRGMRISHVMLQRPNHLLTDHHEAPFPLQSPNPLTPAPGTPSMPCLDLNGFIDYMTLEMLNEPDMWPGRLMCAAEKMGFEPLLEVTREMLPRDPPEHVRTRVQRAVAHVGVEAADQQFGIVGSYLIRSCR